MTEKEAQPGKVQPGKVQPHGEFTPLVRWTGLAIALLCLGIGVALIANRSQGLDRITVTALDAEKEPRDHNIPLFKAKEALPDYRLIVRTTDRWKKIQLGAKPNKSAVDGISWELPDPISLSDVASIRLEDEDKLLADALAEVQVVSDRVEEGNYKFEFATSFSPTVGVRSFFKIQLGRLILFVFIGSLVAVLASAILPGII